MPDAFHSPQHELLLDLLREARSAQGMTQVELAEALGFRQTDISKVERGVRRLDVLELRAWAKALGLEFVAFAQELDSRLEAQEVLRRQTSPGAKSNAPRPRRGP